MELLHVLGNTYAAVAATALLPVYKLNDRDVVLIDTGYAKLDRAGLTALIDGSGWRLRAHSLLPRPLRPHRQRPVFAGAIRRESRHLPDRSRYLCEPGQLPRQLRGPDLRQKP